MNLFKISIFLVLFMGLIFADTQDNNDSFEKGHRAKNIDGYMPNIITPEASKSGIYGGYALSTGYLDSSNNGSNGMLNLSLIAGYNISKYLATEGRATISIAYDDGIDYKNVSLFLKPKYEAYEGLDIYSLIGIGRFSADSINGSDTKSSKTALQYGLGANYKLKNNFKIFADYTYLGKDDGAVYKGSNTSLKSGSFTTGITYDF